MMEKVPQESEGFSEMAQDIFPKIKIYTYQKAGIFCRNKRKRVAELLWEINLPISQSGPDSFVTNEAET